MGKYMDSLIPTQSDVTPSHSEATETNVSSDYLGKSVRLFEEFSGITSEKLTQNKDEIRYKLLSEYAIESFIMGGLLTWYNAQVFKGTELSSNCRVALSVIDLSPPGGQFGREEGIEQEVTLSKRLGPQFAVQTHRSIELPKIGAVVLVQELADADIDRAKFKVNETVFLAVTYQCPETLSVA